MNYRHFTIEERCCLREYYVKGKSYREIARLLGRNVSSISRELRRNCTFFRDIPRYYPYTAQKKSNLRNSYRHRGMFWKQEVLDYIDEKLSQTWSPEQISKTPCGMKMPSFKTIYRWIDERYLRSTLKSLRRKGKTRKRLGNGGRFTTGKSIRKRDGGVRTREKQGVFCHARGEKDEILYCREDPGQERRNDGESNHRGAFPISQRSGKDDHL